MCWFFARIGMSSTGKSSFFRQSGWMVIATFAGGIFMLGVQLEALNVAVMEKSDCTTFIALLGLLMIFGGAPSSALQTIFAQQSAAAVTDEKRAELAAAVRALLKSTFILWLAIAALGMVFAGPVSSAFRFNSPAAVRVTIFAVLATLWAPTFKGLLQGLHRFGSFGWLLIAEGVIRLAAFVLLVKWLKGGAPGGLWAVSIGQYLILAAVIWLTRDVWSAKTQSAFSWKDWLRRGAPFTLATGAYYIMTCRPDALFVKSCFTNATNVHLYNSAMFIGFAMIQFIAPIAAVMFPTIVRNLALSKKSDALFLTMAVTGGFACLAAAGCTLFPRLPFAFIMKDQAGAAPLVPWFVWALAPLTMANVLIQNLLARGKFTAAPWLILVPVLYGATLLAIKPVLLAMPDDFTAFRAIIQTMGFFCLLLFGVAAWFTWRAPATEVSRPGSEAAR